MFSKAVKSALQPSVSERTLVMAAVNVVLPWSTWPMVPMLTCGFVRSNFSLAIKPSSLRSSPLRDLPFNLSGSPTYIEKPPCYLVAVTGFEPVTPRV